MHYTYMMLFTMYSTCYTCPWFGFNEGLCDGHYNIIPDIRLCMNCHVTGLQTKIYSFNFISSENLNSFQQCDVHKGEGNLQKHPHPNIKASYVQCFTSPTMLNKVP